MKSVDVIKDFEYRVWTCKDYSAIMEYCLNQTEVHSTILPQQDEGLYAVKESILRVVEAFPDIQFWFDDYVAGKNQVVSRWRARGTHLGYLHSVAPTGKPVSFTGLSLYVVVAGKIRHYQCQAGFSAALKQLEVI